MFSQKLSRRAMAAWCTALALGCILGGMAGLVLQWGQAQLDTGAALCADTLRLHIRADSDSLLDQSAKLAVRDALLAYADAQGAALATQPEALRWAAQHLPALEWTARRTLARLGLAPAVRIELVNMYFSAARYPRAALPAGRYDAVRIELGDDAHCGRNWWCVLYPGLCRSACGGYAFPEENDLVCGEYLVRFRLVDWWNGLTANREDRLLLA